MLQGGDDRPCVKDVFASERRNAKAGSHVGGLADVLLAFACAH